MGGSGLKLEEAILYVDGNLHVRGPLSGKGAVFVTGTVTLESTALGALDQLALIAGGDLTITGRAGQRSKLVGLLASKGNLHLSDLTVVGAVVCAGSADRVLEMSNVNVLGNSAGLDFAFELGWGRAATSYGLVGGGTRGGAGRLVRMVAKPDGRGGMRPAVPTDFIDRYDPRNPGADLIQPGDFEVVELDSSGQPVLGPDHQPIAHSFSESGLDFNDPFLVGKLLEKLQDTARTQAQSPTESIMSAGKLSLDLNKFLKVGETLQVVFRTIR